MGINLNNIKKVVRYRAEKSMDITTGNILSSQEFYRIYRSFNDQETEYYQFYMDKLGRIADLLRYIQPKEAEYKRNVTALLALEFTRRAMLDMQDIINDLIDTPSLNAANRRDMKKSLKDQTFLMYDIYIEKGAVTVNDSSNLTRFWEEWGDMADKSLGSLKAAIQCYDDFADIFDCGFIYGDVMDRLKRTVKTDFSFSPITSEAYINNLEKTNPKQAARLRYFVIYPDYDTVKPDKKTTREIKKILGNYEAERRK